MITTRVSEIADTLRRSRTSTVPEWVKSEMTVHKSDIASEIRNTGQATLQGPRGQRITITVKTSRPTP